MPEVRPNQLRDDASSAPIFASAAFDPPIALPTRRLKIAAIAMAVAAAIWLLVAAVSLGAGASEDLLLMSFVGAGFDAFVAVQLWQQQWSRTVLLYVIVRAFLAGAGFVILCLPFYLIAVVAIPFGRPTMPPDPDVPHAFQARPGLSSWMNGRQTIFGRQLTGDTGTPLCACGKPQRDEIHNFAS